MTKISFDVEDRVLERMQKFAANLDWNKEVLEFISSRLEKLEEEAKQKQHKSSNSSSKEIVSKIINSPYFLQGIFGCFSSGHQWERIAGQPDFSKVIPREYTLLNSKFFKKKEVIANFEGCILCVESLRGFPNHTFFYLDFVDRTVDSRKGSHTAYLLGIPKSEERILSHLKENPSLVATIFMEKFPIYDHSEGNIKIIANFGITNSYFE